ncbi:MAG: hypothetical protein V3V01_17925 [Acidimicrobiales bacterium]
MAALAAVVAAPVAALKIIEKHPWKKVGTSGRYQVDPMWGGYLNTTTYPEWEPAREGIAPMTEERLYEAYERPLSETSQLYDPLLRATLKRWS